jgi:hypothetical protein
MHRDTYLTNLAWAAERAAAAGVDILIEPINGCDMPGYFLSTQAEAHAVVQEVGASNLKVQLDLYHCQIVEGDLTATLRRDLPTGRVGHLQIAGVPDRKGSSCRVASASCRFPAPILDTTSDHRARNGQITRRLRVGRRRHCPSRSSPPAGPWPQSLGRRACCPARGSPACRAPRPWRAGVRPRPEMRDEPGRTRPGDAWYVRCRFASFPKPVEGKACPS